MNNKGSMMENLKDGLENLVLWQKSMEFSKRVCKYVVSSFPSEEKYALGIQLKRSVQSIPANIAEGYGRFYYQEGIRFCYLARGSLEETLTHLHLAHELKYLSDETFSGLKNEIIEIRRLISGYVAFLKTSKRGSNEPGSCIRDQINAYSVNEITEVHPVGDEEQNPDH